MGSDPRGCPEGTQEEAIAAYFKHLKANLQLPCEVTGTEDFRWEELYVIGGWSQQEYERLKKPSLRTRTSTTCWTSSEPSAQSG